VFETVISGFLAALGWEAILLVLVGTVLGLFVGSVPGLTATMALALLVPFTFTMDPLNAMVLLGAVYVSSMYGGAFTAILINTPGTPGAIATTLDGYPMAQQGKAELAILVATVASVVGGIISVIFVLLLAAPLTEVAIRFGPAEYFWVAVLGLSLIGALSTGSLVKGLLGGAIGMLIGTIGVSPLGGESRFLFGTYTLQGGVNLLVALIGIFAIPELIRLTATAMRTVNIDYSRGSEKLSHVFKVTCGRPLNVIRSSVIGLIVGIIPGAGNNVAGLVAYNEAKRASRDPHSFGKGNPEGVVASESSNNAAVAGSVVPLLTLGVPGSPPAAVMLGALMLHGIRPGTALFVESGTLAYGFIFSLGIAAIALLVVGVIGGRLICRAVCWVPLGYLVPTIAFMTIIGAYSMRNSMVDVFIMLGLGVFAYAVRYFGIHAAPIALGLILGPIAEDGFGMAMLQGTARFGPDWAFLGLFVNPLSWVLIALTVLTLFWPAIQSRRGRQRALAQTE
jgi:putative tricarboxylic transport membrane protein